MRFCISTYSLASEGYKKIREKLNALGIRPDNSQYRYRPGDVVINWGLYGSRSYPIHANQPSAVGNAVFKRRAYNLFYEHGVPTVDHTEDVSVATEWAAASNVVYIRDTETGSQGRGITVCRNLDSFTRQRRMGRSGELRGRFFTKGFKSDREFRVHVAFRSVIEVCEKLRRNGTNPDPLIRSHGDWVFCKNNLRPYPNLIKSQAVRAIMALGLDFGGVDIALSRHGDTCVFEVNTAPGIEGTTVDKYADAFKQHFN